MRGVKKRGLRIRFIFYLLLLVLLILIAYLLFDLGVFSNLINSGKKAPAEFGIPDGCSIIAGKLIHTINNDGNCRIMCRAECEVRKMDFSNSSFSERTNGCSICDCSCV